DRTDALRRVDGRRHDPGWSIRVVRAARGSECARAGFGDGLVLLAGAAADAEATDDFTALLEGDAAGEDHDLAVVGGGDAEELAAGLAEAGEILGGDVEGPGGPGLLDGDVDAAEPGVLHALEGDEVATGVDDGDVHG